MALLAVFAPPRLPDAHRRSPNPAVDGGNLTGLAWAMIGLIAATSVPPALIVLAGTLLDSPALRWAGVPAGVAVGALAAWWLGRIAYRRLETGGPELLLRLRSGTTVKAPPVVAPAKPARAKLARARAPRLVIALCLGSGWIPLLAGVLSLVKAFSGQSSQTGWTFVLALPRPLWIPVSAGLIALWLLLYSIAGWTALRLRRRRSSDH
ncbi:putative membrane protein [Kutzneria albida DSM 43870]|nr:putative membrane protein [Kutzneria albida DSM 43870]